MRDRLAELIQAVRDHVAADECGCVALREALDFVDRETGRIICAADRDNRRFRVELDGVYQPTAYRACAAEGWVQRYVVDEHGRPTVHNDGLRLETVYGVVTISDPRAATAA